MSGIPSAVSTVGHTRPWNKIDLVCIRRITMRSELVFGAMTQVPNRLLLVKLASKATRILHRPNSRIQETMNDVFERFSHANSTACVRDTENMQLLHRAA